MFGIDLWDGALAPALAVALLGGVLSFLSPCVLPIVPPYLAYMAGTSIEDMRRGDGADRRVMTAAVFFVLGLSTVFLILGLAASAFGRMFLAYQREMGLVGGAVILLFGLHFLGVLRIPLLYREARFDAGDQGGTPLGAYLLGLAFAFGWTPCIGPVLGSILSLAAQEGSVERGMLLMAGIKRHMALIERLMGGLLLVVGLLMLTGGFTAMSFWLLETFPGLALIG